MYIKYITCNYIEEVFDVKESMEWKTLNKCQ